MAEQYLDERAAGAGGRWKFVIAGFLINLMLGVIYAWSIFVAPLEKEYGWTRAQTSLTFTLVVVFFAVGMIPSGRWVDRKGPRLIATVGGAILGISWILAYLTTSLEWLYLSYGVIGGIGIGLAYNCPIPTGVRWFPDRRGLVTGLIVMGFGMGALFLAPLANSLIVSVGWRSTFLYMGVLFLIVVCACAQILKFPPAGYKPSGWTPPPPTAKVTTTAYKDYVWREMIKTPQFVLIWLWYWFTAASGLLMIGQLAPFAQESGIARETAVFAVGFLSFFNGLGRPGFGALSDKIGRRNAMVIDALVMGIFMAAAQGLVVAAKEVGLFLTCLFIGLCYGGVLALMPAITADFFGTKNLGLNYGAVFTAWGAAGVLGPYMAGYIRTVTGTYITAFYVAALLNFIAAGLSFVMKRPAPPVEAPAAAPAK
jgi:OFA family oxalate/formate antiporter-like MFS transporter